MDDEDRDIGPDEVWPNYSPENLPNGSLHSDVEEDATLITRNPQGGAPGYTLGVQSRNRRIIQEPIDTTNSSVETIHERVFGHPHRQGAALSVGVYAWENKRLSTFSDWRFQHVVRKEDLARNGFVYTGSGDKVRCVYCNGILREWDVGDVVEEEHRRNYPTCPLLSGANVENIPLAAGMNGHHAEVSNTEQHTWSGRDTLSTHGYLAPGAGPSPGYDISPAEEGYAVQVMSPTTGNDVTGWSNSTSDYGLHKGSYSTPPRHPHMLVESDRLATFTSWPVQLKQKPEDLAHAGLFYTGDGDRVRCFHCSGLLSNWEPTDDPFQEHAHWFPKCQYINLLKGETFVHDVQNGRVTEDSVMQSPAVLAVLSEGHSVDTVQKALFVLRQREGVDVVVKASELLKVVLELEDAARPAQPAQPTTNGHASLPHEVEKLLQENESLRDKQLCKICMDKDVSVVFYPCKHFMCCTSCAAALSTCPICRVPIDSKDEVYMA